MINLLNWFRREVQYQVAVSSINGDLITFYFCKAKSKKEACQIAMTGLKKEYGELIELKLIANKLNPKSLGI